MRDSRAHVEASGGRPQGRLQAAVRHRRRGRVRDRAGSTCTACSAGTGTAASRPSSRARAGRAPTPAGRRTQVRERIVALRTELTARGLDAGPVTIAWHLGREGLPVPSTSTIRRILHAGGPGRARAAQAPAQLLDPLRGRGAQRAVAVRLHPLAPGRRERGRDLLAGSTTTPATCSAARPSGGSAATTWWPRSPRPATPTAGPPPRSPTTAPSTRRASPGAATASSTCSPTSASARRTGRPGHPQTQGKIERFHQTLKRWLGQPAGSADPGRAAGPARRLPPRLQRAAAAPGDRPGHARRGVPGDAQGAARRARRRGPLPPPLRRRPTARARSPCAGPAACTTSRSARPMPAGGSWPSSTSTRSRSSPSTPARSSRPTCIEPDRRYWRNQRRDPGRWPGSPSDRADRMCRRCRDSCVAYVATHDNGAPGGIRTPDPLIRSQMLCPLSYGRVAAW